MMYISQKWLRFCEISCTGKGVTSNEQRKALPLHCWGVELQDVYFTFEPKRPGNGKTEYSVVKKSLTIISCLKKMSSMRDICFET